jgi:5-methylcytosine-specific restriction enzyme B
MKPAQQDGLAIQRGWLATTLPDTTAEDVQELLLRRKYAVIEGPPGTSKTRLATALLAGAYRGAGKVIQFHPGTTYETFVGGLSPQEGGAMGFTFAPQAGHLMEAVVAARQSDAPYLLVIDEINRADLSKVLGEAIYLFEPGQHEREVALAHSFPEVGDRLQLPPNLHVLGTMNSADRSIAILDLAVRRRFAFVPLWPQLEVVERDAGETMQRAFHDLLMVFLEHASDDAFALMPGHAYFLADDERAAARLDSELVPLLKEYLAQGYVAAFADEIQAWLDTYGGIGG